MNRVFLLIIKLILLAGKSAPQKFDLGSWNILKLKYDFNDKWSVFGEAQLRSLKF